MKRDKEKADATFLASMRERCKAKNIDQDRPTWGDVEKLLDLLDGKQPILAIARTGMG